MSTFTFRVTSSATNTAGTQYGQQPDLGAPSFLDMVVTGSSDPMLPNGTYDAYCLNPLLDILLSPTTHTADGAAGNTVASYVPIGFTSLTQQQINQVNWLLSQNFTADAKYGGQFNYGEVQTALWKLVGFSDAQIASAGLDRFLNDNNRNVVSSADINFLIQSAQNAIASGNGVVPTNAYFTAVINPAGDVQPLIVQLQSAKLGNYVWADTDADGLQDGGEVGINNVIVQLYDSNGVLIASTVTGDDFSTAAIEQGYYQFTGLQAGDYQVKFIAPAGQYISQPDTNGNNLDATDSDANTTTGFSHVINLTAGESDQTIDAGLYQKASLGNYVWVDTNNDGQQNDGNTGLNGVTVNLYNSAGELVGTRVTANDANGNPGYYLFDNLTPGDYSVEFVKPAGYNFTQADQGADGSDSDANTTTGRTIVTTLVSGENDLTWDAGLVPHVQVIPASLGNYVWVDSNYDGAQNDGAAQGLNGVTVNLYNSAGILVDTRVTANDANGNPGYYLFDNLTPGDYSVEFVKPAGYAFTKQDQGLDGSDSDANTTTGRTVTTTLVSGENDLTWDAGVVKLASLGDRVWEDTNANGAQDSDETGIGNVTVRLYDCVTNQLLQTTTTDANGNYSFTGLLPGIYHVEFIAPNGYVYSTQDVTAEAMGTDSDANSAGITACYTVNSGDNITTVDAGLYQKASIGDRIWYDNNGNGIQDVGEDGVANVVVELRTNVSGGAGGTVLATTSTDANGYYLFDNLTPGDYHIDIQEWSLPSGYQFTNSNQGNNDGMDSDVVNTSSIPLSWGVMENTTLTSGENDMSWDAGIVKLASLGDRVWEDKNANGVQDGGETGIGNVTVRLYDCVTNQLLKTTTTDVNGNYSFTGLLPGTYHVEFVAPNGYVYSTQNVTAEALGTDSDANSAGITACYTVNSGDTITTVDAGLYQKASLGNYVWVDSNNDGQQNDGNTGLNGVTVNLYNSAGVLAGTRVTANDANGNPGYYLFDNLTPGDYSVEFVKPTGYVFAKQDQGVDSSDSDANTTTGRTITTTLVSGENDLTWDAGLVRLVPGIDIEKTTTGSTNTNTVAPNYDNEDAANGTGVPILTAGSDVTWTYKVTNTGNTNFAKSEIAIVDDNGTATNTADDMSIANGKITYQSGDNGNNVLDAGETWYYKATGTVQPLSNTLGAATTINMAGNSYTDGSDGNSRSYTAGGVTVNASAWSRFKGSDSWSKAWLGTYSGGLGVTDSGEGSGSGSSHTVDNSGRDNYVVFQFSQNVVVDKAFLNSVVGDSDMTVYVGSSTTPITSMNNAVLNGMTLKELNLTSSSSARWADFNAGNVQGNVLILAARDDGEVTDFFKIEQLMFQAVQTGGVYSNKATVSVTGGLSDSDLSHYQTAPALKASIGDKVWEDLDHDNVQDANEPGIANIKVMLQNSSGVTIATMYTDANGNYKFTNLDPGTYRLVFDKTNVEYSPDWMEGYYYDLNDWMWAKKNVGSNDSIDSDVNGDGVSTHNVAYTDYTTLTAGENDMTWDAGITPIVIDLNGDGIKTLSRANSDGTFDLFGNGSAVNSGWLSGEDGFLAVDVNGNGKIDDITELFGGLAKGDGFAKLASYDSNGDGVVDASDAEFASLKIWQDANGNHQTDAGELVSLSEAGVASLTVSYTELPFIDAQGNLHLERSSATLADGSSVDMTDVYFNVAAEDAAAANVEIATLGQLVGDDSGLDGLLYGLGGGGVMSASSSNAEMFDCAGLDSLSRMAALYEEQAACCA